MTSITPIIKRTYYHGGIGGKLKGEMILPPSITRVKCGLDFISEEEGNPARRDKVYITTSYECAMMYAATKGGKHRPGLYEVTPIGLVELDPDYTGDDNISFRCDSAQITKKLVMSREDLIAIRDIILDETPLEKT